MAGRPIAVPPGWASSNAPRTVFPFDKETENSREEGREVLQIAGSESRNIPASRYTLLIILLSCLPNFVDQNQENWVPPLPVPAQLEFLNGF